jgi:hypothetical protein
LDGIYNGSSKFSFQKVEIWRKEQRELVYVPSVTSILRRQLKAFCAVSYKHFAPSVTSVLRCQLEAFCADSYKHFAPSVTSILRRQLQALCVFS